MSIQRFGPLGLLCSTAVLAPMQSLAAEVGADEAIATREGSTVEGVTVTGAHLRRTIVAGKSDLPLIETPQAVSVTDGMNVYASWSKSFLPQLYSQQVVGLDAAGNPIGGPIAPERGKNVELGLKFAPDSAPVSGSLAIYQLTRQNVVTADPVYPNFSVVTGEQRSRGFEAELSWAPIAGFGLDLAYTYVDAEVTKDNFFTVGAPLSNVPKHNIGAFAHYEAQDGPLAGFGATLAVSYNSKHNGDIHSTRPDGGVLIWLPAYTLVDAGISYRRDDWGAQLTVANLLDKRFWPDTGGIDRVTPGNPRNWRLTLSREF